jgi:hypothetical protein
MKSLQRSLEPHLNICHEVSQGRAVGSTKDEYVLYMTIGAWRYLDGPRFVKLAIKTRTQSIRVSPVDESGEGTRSVSRLANGSCRIGNVNRIVDVGMRTGRYLYKGNNIFVHE